MEQRHSPRKIRDFIYLETQTSPEDIGVALQELFKIFGEKLDVLENFLGYIIEGKWLQVKE
jgi:hypothetical protein